nr:NEDD4-binding protein 2-like 1 [Procambarus clarkii]
MVLMRGLLGSGKFTLAIKQKGTTGVILSTDSYFYNTRGKYGYDPSRIGDAHQWNKQREHQKLQDGKTSIILDNTNLQTLEMKPYVKLGLQYDYEVDILDADTPWKLNPDELARRNSHGVPKK